MFDDDSRYDDSETYEVEDARGRRVRVISVPDRPDQQTRGIHRRKDGQRLDHLAHRYLGDATRYWRICAVNGAMFPEQMAEVRRVAIPEPED